MSAVQIVYAKYYELRCMFKKFTSLMLARAYISS